MAIKYLDTKRIRGSSTASVTTVQGTDDPTLDFDFSSQPTGWNYRIAGSTSHWDNDNSRLNWETKSAGSGSGADYDLGVAQTENWVLRFKFSIDSSQSGHVSAGQGDGVLIFGLQNYPSTSAYTASTPNSANDSTYAENHQVAQAMVLLKPNQSSFKIGGRCEVTDSANMGWAGIDESISQDTNYWVEVRRTSATTFTIKAFTNSNYSSNQVGSTGTFTVSSGALDGVRYIHFEEHAQNVSYDSYGGGILTDLEFWGTTAVAKDKSTITSIPAGVRYHETDTRKIFRRKIGGDAQVQNVFNTSNYTYTTAGQSGAVTVTNGDDPSGSIRINLGTGSTSPTYAYATLDNSFTSSDKTFQIDCDITRGSGSSGDNFMWSLTSYVWSDNSPSSGNKHMQFRIVNGGSGGTTPTIQFRMETSTAQVSTDSNTDFTQAQNSTHHYRITGDGTNWKFEKWDNANGDYSGTPDEDQTGLTFPSDWASTNAVDKVQFGWWGYWNIDTTVKNVTAKFGTGTADSWVEKGTA